MKKLFILLAVTCALHTASATLYNFNFNDVNQAIPDGDEGGVSDTHNLSGMDGVISSLSVTLHTTGGYNGDLYGYLVSDAGFAVLLNRIGSTSGNPYGSSGSGMDVTFYSSAVIDIHSAGYAFGSSLTGTFQADGRETDPNYALNTDARTASLSSFLGNNPNGNWTLFLADVSPVGESTLVDWGLSITTSPVPEPVTVALAIFAIAGAGFLWLRANRRTVAA
jgi:subtilisin-like proprotein convertase family protein